MPTLGPRAAIAFNLTLYYSGWVACVLGAATGRWVTGAVVGTLLVGVHLALVERRSIELRLMLEVTAIGYTADSAQTALGLLVFPSGPLPDWAAPLWIGVLWMLFATTLRYAFFWLSGRRLLAAAFGAVGGPAAFYAGCRLGAVQFHPSTGLTLAVLAGVWALLLPLLVHRATQASAGAAGRYSFGNR